METSDYSMFVFRKDNRAAINQKHVERLVESIKSNNLLHFKPILVNQQMEIIDGQHRLLAAQKLKVSIYYKIEENFNAADVLTLNLSKSWNSFDYLNYFCMNGYLEYARLKDFMATNKLNLKVAMALTMGTSEKAYNDFRSGKYIFNCEDFLPEIERCWETIAYIKKIKGESLYTSSARFWKCLLMLVKHPEFNPNQWFRNLEKLISRIGPRASAEEYCKMLEDVYSWKTAVKIKLT